MLSTGLLRYPPGARMPPSMPFTLSSSKLRILQRAARLACGTLLLSFAASAVDLNGLFPIGPMADYTASGDGITITCTDQSQVRFQVLAADLIRVRASFGKPLPERDHSWAVAKRSEEHT